MDELSRLAAVAGGDDGVLEALRRSWPSLVAGHGEGIRSIMDALPPSSWDSDPWLIGAYAASYRSVGSHSRSAAEPYFFAAEAAIPDDAAPGLRSAIIVHHAAYLRSKGRLAEAMRLATEARELAEADRVLPLALRMRFRAKSALHLGTVLYHLGDYDAAAAEFATALGLAPGNLYPAEQLECLGGAALVAYSMGEFDRSTRFVTQARQLPGTERLIVSQFGAGVLIAELLIAVEQSRRTDAERLAPQVEAAAERSDWEPLALYARAAVSIISEEYVEGLELLRRCLQSYRQWQPRGSIATVSEGLRATLLLRLGQTDTAWDILGTLAPTQHHANCPARFIAHLRFLNGDPQGAISALRDCEALGDEHSSRTLVDVLLLKAAASYQLGGESVADVALDRALVLAAQSQMRIPFRLVPDATMRGMLDRALTRPQPLEVRAIIGDLEGAMVGGAAPGTQLSDRERDIMRALMRGLTVAEVADGLFISGNTVKSHVKAIYRKLGVGSRSAAVQRSRELGLQVDFTHD